MEDNLIEDLDEVGDQGDGPLNRGAVERALMWVTETQVMMTLEMLVTVVWQLLVMVYKYTVMNILLMFTVGMIFVVEVCGEQCKLDLSLVGVNVDLSSPLSSSELL